MKYVEEYLTATLFILFIMMSVFGFSAWLELKTFHTETELFPRGAKVETFTQRSVRSYDILIKNKVYYEDEAL